MQHISVVVYDEVMPTAVANTVGLLTSANEAAGKKGLPAPFHIVLVGVRPGTVKSALPVQFHCSCTIADSFDTDVVIVPPMSTAVEEMDALLSGNTPLIRWIREKYDAKSQIISLCTGAFFLAECGLLDGMPATSHWGVIENLQQRYPLIDFRPDHVVTHSKAIITGGGGFSSLNALLYFIESICGKEISVELSKIYALDYGRTSQSIFSVFTGQRLHNDDEIHKAQNYMEKACKTDISVDDVARQVNMSKRNFIRRFKSATSLSPIEFMHRVKVEAAKKAFEAGETNIAAVTYDIGYNDLKTFRTIFKRITGATPVEYRNRYKGQMAG